MKFALKCLLKRGTITSTRQLVEVFFWMVRWKKEEEDGSIISI
jgi:hypothetical protein